MLRRQLAIERAAVRRARRLLLAVAAVVVSVDLVDKVVTPTLPELFHPRPASVVVVMVAATVLGLVVFPRTGSLLLGTAGGLLVGGGLANTISVLAWGRGVPNPLVSYRYAVAFNVADLAVAAGFLLLLPGAVVFAWQHRHELDAELV